MDCTAQYNAMILAQADAAVAEAEWAVEEAEAEIAAGIASDKAVIAWDREVEYLYCMGGGGSSSRTAGDTFSLKSFNAAGLRKIREDALQAYREHLAEVVSRRDEIKKLLGV